MCELASLPVLMEGFLEFILLGVHKLVISDSTASMAVVKGAIQYKGKSCLAIVHLQLQLPELGGGLGFKCVPHNATAQTRELFFLLRN